MRGLIGGVFLSILVLGVFTSGCGSGKSSGGGTTPTPTPTPGTTATPTPTPTATATPSPTPAPTANTITVTFAIGPAPVAVAEQINTGNWTVASIKGQVLSVNVPAGITKYAIAYVCPNTVERVIEATVLDDKAYSVGCPYGKSAAGNATGSVNASGITGATNLAIFGALGNGSLLGAVSGTVSFNALLPTGANDIAAVASNSSGDVLAVKILRSQTVPGAINGNNTIFLTTADATTTQSISVTNPAAGFVPPTVNVQYNTVNGTIVTVGTTSTSYRAISSSDTQSGDFYSYQLFDKDIATGNSFIQEVRNTTSGGGPITLQSPPGWSYSGPVAAAFPTFDYNYSGLPANTVTGQAADITWSVSASVTDDLAVLATGAYQNGATVLAIPDLTALSGFLPTPNPIKGIVYWTAYTYSSTQHPLTLFTVGNRILPADSSITLVANQGSYLWPPPP